MTNYSLTAYTNVLGSHEKVKVLHTIPSVAESWERSVALQGGDWVGRFRLSGLPFRELIDIFNNWLGYDIQENSSGVRWGGMVYEMELHDNLIRRRSLEPMVNLAYGRYEHLVNDGGFEVGGGSPFTFWTSVVGASDSITAETTLIGTGTQSAKITNGGGSASALSQFITVSANTDCRVSFYTRGDGTVGGRYRIYDNDNAADIVALTDTGVTGTDYRRITEEFTTPAGCETIVVILHEPTALGSAYYDDVIVEMLRDGKPFSLLTAAAESGTSQAQYGTKMAIANGRTSAEAEAMRDQLLATNGSPVTERESGQAGDEPYIDVMVCGYTFTQKWAIRVGGASATTKAVASALVSDLLDICEYVSQKVLSENAAEVSIAQEDETARKLLMDVVAVGDGAGNPWRLHMNHARVATYEAISNTPVYHLRGGEFYEAGGSRYTPVASRQLRPGVVRDLDYPVSGAEPGSWFLDRRDFLLDEISVAADGSLRWGIAEV